MPVIVAFGDSNTWGYDPATKTRFDKAARWTGVMARALGGGFEVIEEGLNGRTSVFDDPIEPHRNGSRYLPPCLMSHAPLDLVILALGCNDMKARFGVPPSDIAAGADRLVAIVTSTLVGPKGRPPRVLLVAPPPIAELTEFAEMFAGAAEKSKALGGRFRAVAEMHGVGFVDAGQFIACSTLDGIHYEAPQHAMLGAVMAEAVKMTLGADAPSPSD